MIETITTAVSLGITAATTIFALIKGKGTKNQKTKVKKLENVNKLAKIIQKIPELINEAEEIFNYEKSGKAKMSYVLKDLQVLCKDENIEFDKQALTEEVEKILSTPTIKKGEKNGKTENEK